MRCHALSPAGFLGPHQNNYRESLSVAVVSVFIGMILMKTSLSNPALQASGTGSVKLLRKQSGLS